MVEVKLRTFIPSEAVNVTVYRSNFVNGGDNRGFSSSDDASFRTSQSASLNFSSNGEPLLESSESEPSATNISTQYSKDDASGSPSDWRWNLNEGAERVNEAQLDPAGLAEPEISVEGDAFSIAFETSGADPIPPPALVPVDLPGFLPTIDVEISPPNSLVPAVDANLEVLVSQDASGAINYTIDGSHDGFPAYELYIDDTLVYAYDPILAGNGPLTLFPPQDIDIIEYSGTIAPGTESAPFPSEPGVAFGTTEGTFDTITPEPSADPLNSIEGEGTNQLSFGVASPNSSFTFDNEESFQAVPNESFVLGTFTHENGITPDVDSDSSEEIYTSELTISTSSPFRGSVPVPIDLPDISLPFDPIDLLFDNNSAPDFNDSLTEELTLTVTPNLVGNTAEESADIISFSNSLGSFNVFEGETATVELLGTFEFGRLNFTGFGEVLSGSSTGFVELS